MGVPIQERRDGSMWDSFRPYATSSMAAAISMAPVIHGMNRKTDFQIDRSFFPRTYIHSLKNSPKPSGVFGIIVGMEMKLQEEGETYITHVQGIKDPTMSTTIKSSIGVGACASPFLAVYNGYTMQQGVRESLKKFNVKQMTAITLQEGGFVGGICLGAPLRAIVKEHFGDSAPVQAITTFGAASIGVLAGHPANTVLTRMQYNLPVGSWRGLMKGAPHRVFAMSTFSVLYEGTKRLLDTDKSLPLATEKSKRQNVK